MQENWWHSLDQGLLGHAMKSQMKKYIEVTAPGFKHVYGEKGVALASIAAKQEATLCSWLQCRAVLGISVLQGAR